MNVLDKDFPALFQTADSKSLRAQKCYLRLVKWDLILLVLGSFLSTIYVKNSNALQVVGLIVLIISCVISLVIKLFNQEHVWYGARAVAESVKTLSWKYMTGTSPYLLNLNPNEVDKIFTNDLLSILSEKKELCVDFEEDLNNVSQISEKMRKIRAENLNNRLDLYLNKRLRDQKEWYSKKAKYNKRRESNFFTRSIIAQLIAVIVASCVIRWDDLINTSGVFVALAVAFFAWMQIKKFQELAQSYALAAQELGLAEATVTSVKNDCDLSSFVHNTESAMSREHTMWIARRGQ